MTKFQLGLIIGGFIGALITFLVLGIIHLFAEERQGKTVLSRKRIAWESQDAGGMLAFADHGLPDHCPTLSLEELEIEWTRRPPSP